MSKYLVLLYTIILILISTSTLLIYLVSNIIKLDRKYSKLATNRLGSGRDTTL